MKIKKVWLFLIITFTISYATAALYYLLSSNYKNPVGFTIMAVAYMFTPFISVIIVKKISKEPVFSNLTISFKLNRWFLVAWLLFPVIVFCTIGISVLLPWLTYNPEMTGIFNRYKDLVKPEAIEEFKNKVDSFPPNIFILLYLIQGFIAGITVNAIAGLGEEIGWRGFLLREFKEMRFFKASLIIGFIWGIWHAPLILMGHNYPQHPQIGVLMMTIWCILLAPLFQYVAIKAKSVIAAAITHGTLNAFAGFTLIFVDGGNDLTAGIQGLPGFITLIIANMGLFIYDTCISREKITLHAMSDY